MLCLNSFGLGKIFEFISLFTGYAVLTIAVKIFSLIYSSTNSSKLPQYVERRED